MSWAVTVIVPAPPRDEGGLPVGDLEHVGTGVGGARLVHHEELDATPNRRRPPPGLDRGRDVDEAEHEGPVVHDARALQLVHVGAEQARRQRGAQRTGRRTVSGEQGQARAHRSTVEAGKDLDLEVVHGDLRRAVPELHDGHVGAVARSDVAEAVHRLLALLAHAPVRPPAPVAPEPAVVHRRHPVVEPGPHRVVGAHTPPHQPPVIGADRTERDAAALVEAHDLETEAAVEG